MDKNASKAIKIIFAGLLFLIGTVYFSSMQVVASTIDKSEVGIQFVEPDESSPETQGDKPILKDNTPKPKDGSKPSIKKMSLPNTGEIVKQLSFLVGMMILIVLSFVFILDKQSKANKDQ